VASVPNSDIFIITGKKKLPVIYLYHINVTKFLFIHLHKTYLQILCVFIPFISGMYILGKAVPLQAWAGPEGSRKLRLPDFVTTAQDGGKVVSLTHRPPLPPRNTPVTHFC